MKLKDKLKEFKNSDFLYKLKSFLNKYNTRIISVIAVLLFMLLLFLSVEHFENEKQDVSEFTIYANNDLVADENKIMMQNLLMNIANIDKIETGHLDTQVKFLTKEEAEAYKDLMSLTLSTNINNKNNSVNLRGFVNLDMPSVDISLKFPVLANGLTSKDYELYLDIPSSYKTSFNMNQDVDYLYVNNISMDYINETYGVFNGIVSKIESSTIEIPVEDFVPEKSMTDRLLSLRESLIRTEYLENMKYIEEDNNNGIFEFNFDSDDVIIMMNTIIEDELFNNSYILNDIFPALLKDSSGFSNILNVKGQVATNNNVATDIYLEIEKKSGTIIAFRMLFTDINNEDIVVDKFESDKIKNLSEFIDEINSTKKEEPTNTQSDKTITIGDVYFTGEDETTKLEEFLKENLPSVINVFLNFTDCTKQTNLVIKWFYEDQDIPIIETKISNGDYEKGMLKTSISFVDTSSVQTGKYTLKVFIEGQENCVFENYFEIK